MPNIYGREGGVHCYAHAGVKKVSDAPERGCETSLAADRFMDIYRALHADLDSFYVKFSERPRAAFIDQRSVREEKDIIPTSPNFAENSEEVLPEEGFSAGNIEARREC